LDGLQDLLPYAEGEMTKRGQILMGGHASFNGQGRSEAGLGLMTVEGKQYSFVVEGMWHSEVAPQAGMLVEVEFDLEGAPERIFALSGG